MEEKLLKNENKKPRKHFITGLIAVLPTVLFLIILGWILNMIFNWVGGIVSLFPHDIIETLKLPDFVVGLLGFLILCGLIWLLGFIINRGSFGKKVRNAIDLLTSRVPLLDSLSKITNQVANTLQNTNSFKKVILVRFPMEKTWSVGFLTGENAEVFQDAVDEKHLVSVFIPTTPNPTNGYLVLMNPKDYIETEVPVSSAISFIISMGTAGATEEIIKKSHSNIE